MPVPKHLTSQIDKKHSIFFYCATLENSANAVAFILKQTEYLDVTSDKDLKTGEKNKAPVVWVVGHGLQKNENVVNNKSQTVVHIKDIVEWCLKFGAKDLVDTCCYPFARRDWVKKNKPGLNYYCKSEDKVTKRIGNYQKNDKPTLLEFDAWWDGEKIAKAHP